MRSHTNDGESKARPIADGASLARLPRKLLGCRRRAQRAI